MKNILVIDDDHLVVKSLSRLLEVAGYIVKTAESGQEALAKISESKFDLIIADIRMPVMNGVETIQNIQQYLQNNDKNRIPVIFITGYTDSNVQDDAKKLNASDFIYKPFDKELFLRSIKQAIGS